MAVRYLNATGTQALITEIKARLALKANQTTVALLTEQLQQVSDSIPTKTSQLTNDSAYVTQSEGNARWYSREDAATLTALAQQNQTNIGILNADSETEGSVDYKIAQAIDEGIESISQSEIEELF
mgnify:FL=1